MAIRDRNIEDNNSYNQFAQKIVPITFQIVNASLALSSSSLGAVAMPWAGKIISAQLEYSTSSGTVDIALAKNGTAISDIATSGSTALTLTATTFASGDKLGLIATTAANEYALGSCTIIVRPYLGAAERYAASLGD